MQRPWPALPKLRVLNGGVAAYPPGATFGPRQLPDYEFVWIMEGDAVAHFNTERLSAPAGTILLAQPGMTDSYDWAERCRTVHAFFHFQFAAPPLPWPAPATWPLTQGVPADDVLRPLFRYVLATLNQPEPLRSTLLTPCVDLMVRSFVTNNLKLVAEPRTELPAAVENALGFIRDMAQRDPAPAVTLGELARAAHVSPEHLCRLFRRNLNAGPLECLRRARLERAAALVGRSNLTFKEIAETTGFANPFHFSTAFKTVYRMSPRAYRAAVSEGRPPSQLTPTRAVAAGRLAGSQQTGGGTAGKSD
ncbi:MAG: AraC family transcriptional regulator [Verrucomicrobiota bacterium]